MGKEYGSFPTPAISEMATSRGGGYTCSLTTGALDSEEQRDMLSWLSSAAYPLTRPLRGYGALASPTLHWAPWGKRGPVFSELEWGSANSLRTGPRVKA